ncbi:MAG: gamma-glutamyltransferase family protein [Trueperaceae bacterium]|nr:gamma-glutamyltransferase family protein [Trueperaceae bacterium]
MNFTFPYPSQRMPVMAKNIVSTSQPLAAQAGLRMLLKGGNAVDAALAAAITLTVVEPTSNGIGSDAFAILWDGKQLRGLNASGRSPAALTPERFKGKKSVPLRGWDAVTVPGCVSAWVELSQKFGKLDFETLFEPAIGYARDGYLVSPITARAWSFAPQTFAEFDAFKAGFLPGGHAPKAGEVFKFPDQAKTLELIASSKGEAYYRGSLAEAIAADAKKHGGLMTEEDLANHKADWVGTISKAYGDIELHEIPPNGQGLAALLMLGILKHHDIEQYELDSANSLHVQLEAMKLALADIYRYVSDPATMDISVDELLSDDYLAERAKLIDMTKAQDPKHGVPERGGTVYLTAADENGMMVSFIQSNYYGFGSGIVVPGTGISMQNRGAGFVLDEGHPNEVGPAKRPFHTIIPAFVTQKGQPLMSYGVMGGPMQAQGHAQMVIRMFNYDQNPQTASDAPRWRIMEGFEVAIESGFKDEVLNDLTSRGHVLHKAELGTDFSFGGAQLIYKAEGGYIAGSDHRKDGHAVGY